MTEIKIGEVNFKDRPDETTEDQFPIFDSALIGWPADDVDKLFQNGSLTKTYYPAEFGKDLKIGHQYKIHSQDDQKIIAEVTALEIEKSEYGEGLKITFSIKQGD